MRKIEEMIKELKEYYAAGTIGTSTYRHFMAIAREMQVEEGS